jgi:hypothetical protein
MTGVSVPLPASDRRVAWAPNCIERQAGPCLAATAFASDRAEIMLPVRALNHTNPCGCAVASFFVRIATNIEVVEKGEQMSLSQKAWTRVSMHHVVLAWLRAERGTNVALALSRFPETLWASGLSQLLDHPNFNNPEENRARLRIMYVIRNVFMLEIPPDTEWFEVRNLNDAELSELHAVNHAGCRRTGRRRFCGGTTETVRSRLWKETIA